jgi:hypothetical protein
MSDSAIYDAFALRVGAFAAQFSPTLTVGYPGKGFTPPTTGMWLEMAWFPNETQNYGLADDGPSLLQGLCQVSVCCRPGLGIVDSLAVAGQVIAYFAKGTELAGVRVYRKPWVASVLESPEKVLHPITIPWRGFDS